jgi:hypothetical protein
MTISDFFVPNRQTISSITRSNPAVVTTTEDHGYDDGIYIRLVYPTSFGMTQLIDQVFQATILSATSFSVPIDTTHFDAYNAATSLQVGQVIPVGEISSTLENSERNNYTILPET